MIRLNEYIKEQSLDFDIFDENLMINENKLTDWIKKKLGLFAEKAGKTAKFLSTHYAIGKGIADKNKDKDPETVKELKNIGNSKTPDDAYKLMLNACKKIINDEIKPVKDDNICVVWIEAALSLNIMAKEKNDSEGQKTAEETLNKLKEYYGEETYNKAVDATKNIDKKAKTLVNGEGNSEGEQQPQAQKGEEAGVNDEGKPVATTGTQVEKNTKEAINDNADFLKPLLEKANIDAKVLQKAVNIFSKSIFKEETGNKNGKKVYSWTKEIQSDIDSSALPNKASELNQKIVDGLSSVICGLLILEKESLINGVYRLIDPKGNSKESLMKMINTKKFDLE